MNPTNPKHIKNNLKSKTLPAIIFSFILTMFFLSFKCNLFNSGDSGGIFIPPFSGGGPSLSNPALSIDNTRNSYSSIFDGSHYYLLSRYASVGTNRLIIHRIPSDFSPLLSQSFSFILGSEETPFPTNILDTGSELIATSYVSGAGADYHSAILKINKSSLSLQQHLFFNNTQLPRILFDNSSNHIYLSLDSDSDTSQGYLLILDNNFNILQQYKTDPNSTGYPDAIFLSSHTNSNLCLTSQTTDPSSNTLNAGILIISKSNLSSAIKILTNYSYPTNHYIVAQNPLITTESSNDYVYFADAVNSNTIHINKISVPPGLIASKQISLSSSSINNININKINNQIVVGISKSESSINKLLFIILNPSDLSPIRSFELDVNNNQLFIYHRQKYYETPDNGFILTGDLNPPSYKIFFLKFNNLFNLTENNIFNVVNNPTTVSINPSSYSLPAPQNITLSPSSLTPSTTLYTIQTYPWTSNLSRNP